MKNLKETIKRIRGITLISLIITIVVLILLAGITISLTLGNNGIFNKAKFARDDYINTTGREEAMINDLYGQLQIATSGQVTVDYQRLQDIINTQVESKTQEIEKNVKLSLYPVGSLYISTSSANPSSFIGGTWEAYGQGRTLVGLDTNQTEFNTAEKTGGEKTHTLRTAEMPTHSHSGLYWMHIGNIAYAIDLNGGTNGYRLHWTGNGGSTSTGGGASSTTNFKVGNTGGNGAHNNLQPYITVYMWKRVS